MWIFSKILHSFVVECDIYEQCYEHMKRLGELLVGVCKLCVSAVSEGLWCQKHRIERKTVKERKKRRAIGASSVCVRV